MRVMKFDIMPQGPVLKFNNYFRFSMKLETKICY